MNLLEPEEKQKIVKIRGYDFKIKYISPREEIAITQQRLSLQNGNSVEALSERDFRLFSEIATVDHCSEWPSEFDQHKSCQNWDDGDLITEVAAEVYKFTAEIKERLKKNRPN